MFPQRYRQKQHQSMASTSFFIFLGGLRDKAINEGDNRVRAKSNVLLHLAHKFLPLERFTHPPSHSRLLSHTLHRLGDNRSTLPLSPQSYFPNSSQTDTWTWWRMYKDQSYFMHSYTWCYVPHVQILTVTCDQVQRINWTCIGHMLTEVVWFIVQLTMLVIKTDEKEQVWRGRNPPTRIFLSHTPININKSILLSIPLPKIFFLVVLLLHFFKTYQQWCYTKLCPINLPSLHYS